jgi:putative membrane protein insertion efficiency factor
MRMTDIPRSVALGSIRLYQLILSPLIGNQCRFHPTCSNYAMEAIGRHGVLKGVWLAARRLARCHPFHPGGFDPVPAAPCPSDKADTRER